MKAKPIVPGCTALIIRADNNPAQVGKEVQVVMPHMLNDWWCCLLGNKKWTIHTVSLLRIDDPDIEKQLQQEREKEHA